MSKPPKKRKPRKLRKRWVRVALANVRAQPHEDGAATYAKLWNAAVKDGYNVPFHHDKRATIATCDPIGDGAFSGEIWIYTLVDSKRGVLNLSSGRLLDPAEFAKFAFEFNEHGFNARKIPYVFVSKDHRVAIEVGRGLSPKFLCYILEQALNRPNVLAGTNVSRVEISVEQQRQRLEEILKLKLQSLTIVLGRPNPDDLEGLEEVVRDSLTKQNAAKQVTELVAEEDKNLQPSDNTRKLATIALSTGHVVGHGKDPGSNRTTTITTLYSPLIELFQLDPNTEKLSDVLLGAAKKMVHEIKASLKK